jgi:3-oxoacyl-[acyl-carrier protein] reductase
VFELDDRVVLLTGAGGGIGSATARTLANAGAFVILHDITNRAVESVALELGGRAAVVTADLGNPLAADELWHEALRVRDRIDVLVNNAGIYPPAPLDSPTSDWLEVWTKSLAINLLSPAVLARAAVETFSGQPKGGIIINLASRAAFRGEDADYWHYAAAKAGMVAVTKTIARQNGRGGVTTFALAPGYVDTSLNARFAAEVGIQVAADQTGLGEVAQPQDVANIVAFLASGLARHATGATIDINGASYVH